MMGKSHALSGGVGWLAGCAALTVAGLPLHPATVLIGAAVSTGMALAPDVDHPGSTIARTLGPVTRLAATGVASGAAALRLASCRHCAVRPDRGGHRAVTHTGLGALAAGLGAGLLAVFASRTVAIVVVGFAVWLAAHTALSSRTRARIGDLLLPGRFRYLGKGAHRFAAAVGALLVGGAAAAWADGVLPSGPGLWWIGLAVFWGFLAHSLGDSLTFSAVPLLWPLRIRGCRWAPVGTPRWMRFRTGSRAETGVVWLMAAAGIGAVWLLAAHQ